MKHIKTVGVYNLADNEERKELMMYIISLPNKSKFKIDYINGKNKNKNRFHIIKDNLMEKMMKFDFNTNKNHKIYVNIIYEINERFYDHCTYYYLISIN